jgi:hypothetical protein
MEKLWTHFVPTASAICGVKTEHAELKRYRKPGRICHIKLIFFCIEMFPLYCDSVVYFRFLQTSLLKHDQSQLNRVHTHKFEPFSDTL